MEKKTAASLRKEVYDFLHENGFEPTSIQKSALSKILKSVYEHRVIIADNPAPVEHIITCPKCQGISKKYGKAAKNYKKRIKLAGGQV